MPRLVTLRDFLKEYGITKETFMKEVNKDKSFYDAYIEWEDRDDATIISPKALERLGEAFNDDNTESQKKDNEISNINKPDKTKTIPAVSPNKAVLKKNKQDVFAEDPTMTQVDTQIKTDFTKNKDVKALYKEYKQAGLTPLVSKDGESLEGYIKRLKQYLDAHTPEAVNMSPFMNKPEAQAEEIKPETEKETPTEKRIIKKGTKKVAETRKRKTKYNLTRQFIAEHGFINVGDNIKQLRQMLMSDGSHKPEDVAVMLDEEVKNEFTKSYFVINADEGIYLIKRSTLNSIAKDVLFVEKE